MYVQRGVSACWPTRLYRLTPRRIFRGAAFWTTPRRIAGIPYCCGSICGIFSAKSVSPAVGPHLNDYAPEEDAAHRFNAVLSFFFTCLCTLDGALPQGAPSSPLLSNLVFDPIDARLSAFCAARGITDTRYSDDMTFFDNFSIRTLLAYAERLLGQNGYALNPEKTVAVGSPA